MPSHTRVSTFWEVQDSQPGSHQSTQTSPGNSRNFLEILKWSTCVTEQFICSHRRQCPRSHLHGWKAKDVCANSTEREEKQQKVRRGGGKGKGSEPLFSVILGNKLGRGLRKAALAGGISSGPDSEVSRSSRQGKEATQTRCSKPTKHTQIPPNSNLSCLWDCSTVTSKWTLIKCKYSKFHTESYAMLLN